MMTDLFDGINSNLTLYGINNSGKSDMYIIHIYIYLYIYILPFNINIFLKKN